MDCTPMKGRDTIIDIDRCIQMSKEVGNPTLSDNKIGSKVSFTNCETFSSNPESVNELSPELVKSNKREKRKSTGFKKPPRPPGGLSVDAADQKLIKEITELLMIKRARIERMKALKKTRAAKASMGSTSSSSGNLIAMVFTAVFCFLIVFQGCHSSGNSPRDRLATTVSGSVKANGVAEGNTSLVQEQWNLSTNGVPLTNLESPNLMEKVTGSYSKNEAEKTIR